MSITIPFFSIGTGPTGLVSINKMRFLIKQLLSKHFAALQSSVRNFEQALADEMFRESLISDGVHRLPSFQKLFDEFIEGINSKKTLHELEDHFAKFVKVCIAVGDPVATAAETLSKDWPGLK